MACTSIEYILTGFITNLTKLYTQIRKNTIDLVYSCIQSSFRDLTTNQVTQITEYDTKNVVFRSLYDLSIIDLIYAYFLKYVTKNTEAFDKFMRVDMLKVIGELRSYDSHCIYKVTNGNGKIMIFKRSDLDKTDSNGLSIMDTLQTFRYSSGKENQMKDKDTTCICVHFGNICIDRYISQLTRDVVHHESLMARDVIIMYYFDEKSKWFNVNRIKQMVEILLRHGLVLGYLDDNFNELEYKENDIVL